MGTAKKAYLVLENGKIFEGVSCGCEGTAYGEVVFTTGMNGFQQTLTDPTYYGQIVTQTFPIIGSYGANEKDFESDKCHLNGYIVREMCDEPSNFRMDSTMNEFLKKQNVVGICGIDTRMLTRLIRENGVMNGAITTEEIDDKDSFVTKISAYKQTDGLKMTSIASPRMFKAENSTKHVALLDLGHKFYIKNKLNDMGCDVTVMPYDTIAEQISIVNPDGILISNGPGNPNEYAKIAANIKEIAELGVPVFGIGLGHQLLALANGGKVAKLKYGHRGENQPVIDIEWGRTFVTSQNTGFVVENIPENAELSHKSANDSGCEGLCYKNGNYSVQFYPDACETQTGTSYVFDKFMDLMGGKK